MIDIVSDPVGAPSQPDLSIKPDVVFLLDESGSMSSHQAEVVSTFNEYVRKVKGTAKSVSLYTFDSSGIREKLYKIAPDRVRMLTTADYRPSAATPLFDAMGQVIAKFEFNQRLVQFFTHTDGLENASQEWTKHKLDEKIAHLQQHSSWLFTFLMEGLEGRSALGDFKGLKMAFSSENRSGVMAAAVMSTVNYSQTMDSNPTTYTSTGSDEIDLDKGEEIKPLASGDVTSTQAPTSGGNS